MQEASALEANIDSFQQILVKYLPFPHPSISLMTKDLAQLYTYFNIGDAKTLVKLRENSRGVVHVPIFWQVLEIFLPRLVRSPSY